MEYLCQTCDKFFYDEYSINNPNLKDIDKIITNYVTSYNKKFDIYFIKCDFYLVFNNDFGIHIKTNHVHNKNDLTKIRTGLLYWIEHLKFEGYSFCHINMTYKTYTQRPMHMLERRFNYIFHKCPCLIRALQ